MSTIASVILAAGQGKRLKLQCQKSMAPVLGQTLIDFVIESSFAFFKGQNLNGKVSVVTGHMREDLENYLKENYIDKGVELSFAVQEKQLGTADALKAYFNNHEKTKLEDYTLVICGDTPLIAPEHLAKLYEKLRLEDLDAVVATFDIEDPFGYGRIVYGKNKGLHIVEEKDASEEVKKIKEVNSGLYIFKTEFILKHLFSLDSKNSANEFYLTDLFQDAYNVASVHFKDADSFLGVNTLEQLETVEKLLLKKKINQLRDEGVRFIHSESSYIHAKVKASQGTVIYPNVILAGATVIGENVTIQSGSFLRDMIIESNVSILAYSYLEEAIVRKDSQIGPFARLRSGSDIGEASKIGNFVEIKKSILEKAVKVSHLSYVGDASVGEHSNLGCGFITCNYDGKKKFQTKIGKNCFIGSDSQMIAPIEIGDNSFVASGSTLTDSIPENSFAVARSRQVTKQGRGKDYLKKDA